MQLLIRTQVHNNFARLRHTHASNSKCVRGFSSKGTLNFARQFSRAEYDFEEVTCVYEGGTRARDD